MKPRFFQAVLKEVKGDVLEHVYGKNHNMTLTERMGNEQGICPECDSNSWIILADDSCARVEGGKPYIECMGCGLTSHL
jgi:transposase